MGQTVATQVRWAFTRLRKAPWAAVIRENLYWASFEGLVQSALLAELNRAPGGGRHLADRERVLSEGWKPDLILLRVQDIGAWWAARGQKGVRRREALRRLSRAAVEVKVAWHRSNCEGEASLARKRSAIATNRASLEAYAREDPSRLAVLAVLVAGGHESLRTLRREHREAVRHLGLRGHRSIPVLKRCVVRGTHLMARLYWQRVR